MQANSAEQLNALQANKPFTKTLTDTIAILNPRKRKQLHNTLLAQDMLPTADRADKTNDSVSISTAGIVTVQQATPSLFIIGQLAQIAEQQPNGQWQITRSAFERSATNKEETLRFLSELERLQIGTLPDDFAQQIKMWGGFYGQAAIETLTLIAFQDADTLNDLLQHDALKGVLVPFSGANRPLAVIAKKKVTMVRNYLSRLGIDIAAGL